MSPLYTVVDYCQWPNHLEDHLKNRRADYILSPLGQWLSRQATLIKQSRQCMSMPGKGLFSEMPTRLTMLMAVVLLEGHQWGLCLSSYWAKGPILHLHWTQNNGPVWDIEVLLYIIFLLVGNSLVVEETILKNVLATIVSNILNLKVVSFTLVDNYSKIIVLVLLSLFLSTE
jgi:hypothetical protein